MEASFFVRAWGGFTASEYSPFRRRVAVVRGPRRLAVVCYFPQNSLMWRHCRIAVAIMRKRLRLCGKGREEIPGRPYVGESPVQGRHECFVYCCGGDGFPVP